MNQAFTQSFTQPFTKQVSFAQAIEQPVTQLLLALGSNHKAEVYLPIAQAELACFGRVQYSSLFINPDFTATALHPKPDYSNQCAILTLAEPTNLHQLISQFKQIESQCNRQQHAIKASQIKREKASKQSNEMDNSTRLVTLDIDVLAVKFSNTGNKNEPWKDKQWKESCNNQWIAIEKRYPFKEHEWVGIKQLFDIN